MSSYKRCLEDGECTILVDPKTGHCIYNAGKLDPDVDINLHRFIAEYRIAFRSLLPAKMKSIWCNGKVHHPCMPEPKLVQSLLDDATPNTNHKIAEYAKSMARLATQMACVLQDE